MIGHVYKRATMSKILDEVYVATCNHEIIDYVQSINGKAILTANTHERASDRTAEALEYIEKKEIKYDIVVMLQGDEPMIHPDMIESAVKPLVDDIDISVQI